jgi:hypothetical protein
MAVPPSIEKSAMSGIATAVAPQSDELLGNVTEYWMKARIDAPTATINRLDQNAKQFIALATGLQALLSAVVKIAKPSDPLLLGFAVTAVAFLFLSIVLSAFTLYVQTDYIGTSSILELLRGPRDARMINAFACQVHNMCAQVDHVLRRKRIFLAWGMVAFCFSLLASLACLSNVAIKAWMEAKSHGGVHGQQRVEMVRPHLPPR